MYFELFSGWLNCIFYEILSVWCVNYASPYLHKPKGVNIYLQLVINTPKGAYLHKKTK